MKRVASIQDISCLGRCSLTVALPVISAMEVECAILPTAVLSAHTMFPDILCRDLTADILPIARYWQSQQVRLDAVYTGYLASPRQAEEKRSPVPGKWASMRRLLYSKKRSSAGV